MFQDLIANLTMDQKRELMARGIPQPRISDWKNGKRLPTRPQVLLLAEVVGVDPLTIEAEVMLLETPPGEREHYKGFLSRMSGAVLTLMFLILGMGLPAEKANADNGLRTLHSVAAKYTSWKVSLTLLLSMLRPRSRAARA